MIRVVIILALLCPVPERISAQPEFIPLEKKGKAGYFVLPPEHAPKGLLLLIPELDDEPSLVFQDTALTAGASANGLVLLAIHHPKELLLTTASFRFLKEVLDDAVRRFGVEAEKIALGGFREGGIMAIQFVEECWAAPDYYLLKPRAVFGVETPVDLEEWWRSCERDLQRKTSPEACAQSWYWLGVLKNELGGAPDTLKTVYKNRSPFLVRSDWVGKERFLLPAGIRLYYQGSLQNQLEIMNRDLSDLPVTPASVMIKRLLRQGHTNASLVFTRGPSLWDETDIWNCLHWVADSILTESAKE